VLLSNDKSSVTSSVRTSSVAVLYLHCSTFILQYEKSKKKNHTKSIVQKVTIFYLSET